MFALPWQIRESFRSMREYPARRIARKNLLRIHRAEHLSVGFGGVLGDGRRIHGGAVKLLPLRETFCGNENAFNILYAVSSSQPACAKELFRHCKSHDIRIVWNQNGVGYPAWAGADSERFNAPMRQLRALADFIVYQSKFCQKSAEKFLGACDKPSAILYNPVNCELFFPETTKRPSSSSLRILAAGTHGTRDRVMSALDALAVLRQEGIAAKLTVAGPFQWRCGEKDFCAQASTLGLEKVVHRVPHFSPNDAPILYRAHDLLLHPKYMDPCPTIVLEAMASGLPVVGSDSGGMPELVPPECGHLISAPLDWKNRFTPTGHQLAAAVINLMPNLPEAARAARQNAQTKFAMRPWLKAHEQIFRRVLESTCP